MKFKVILGIFAGFLIVVVVWLFHLNHQMKSRIEHGWFLPPVELYARGEQIHRGQRYAPSELVKVLKVLHYREREEGQTLHPQDFSVLDGGQCAEVSRDSFSIEAASCIYLRTPEVAFGPRRQSQTVLIGFSETNDIVKVASGDPLAETDVVELEPQLFAQFYNGEPILRNVIEIGAAPIECLQAVTAIEDSHFLEHKGVSITGLARAFARNIVAGGYAQGGSTITQQLVKNYFLTPEKTMKRKISELIMAVILEGNVDKDQILQNYLNVIYMGQRGPFQVLGFSAASDFYLNKPLSNLNLPECALLAAIINNPGRYNPFTQPDNARARRSLVLDRMVETQMIDEATATKAKEASLPTKPDLRLTEPAPYFTQAVFRELEKLGLTTEEGLRAFTTLDVEAQDLAQKLVRAHVENLEKNNKAISEIKAAGKELQATLISTDVATGEVLALVGGRQYVKTQYNRILDSHRQVGSNMKPYVYLAALENDDKDGKPYTPTTIVNDHAFTYKYEGQKWSPRNYTKEFYGPIPLFYALKNSLNAATAQVGLQVGLNKIIDAARRAGITSEIQPYPSLTLGAFELYPWEVATGALTIARFGERVPLTFIRSVESLTGDTHFVATSESERQFKPETMAVLIGMLKQTLKTGTGRLATLLGFTHPAAGKTGTTNDLKDTWFTGFTPHVLTVTWTGYDDNTTTGLTGATGALPLWTEFMKAYATRFAPDDFSWPDDVKKTELTPEQYHQLVPRAEPYELAQPTELIFAE